jgi:hypothetical protein
MSYGDVFFQNEVEQSRYAFDESNAPKLFEQFAYFEGEAKRLLEAKLPLPGYEMILKAAHTFNLLDARGAISVTERAAYIGRIRNLSRAVALGESFAATLAASLKSQGLIDDTTSVATPFASPRRLAVHVTEVAAKAADRQVQQKLMPVAVALDTNGNATPALLKKLAALGADASIVPALKRQPRWQGRSPVPRQPGRWRDASRGAAGSAGSRACRAADPEGDELPTGRRLEQREFRAPGAQAGRPAWRRRGARFRARPHCRPRNPGPPLRSSKSDRDDQGCRFLRATAGKRRRGDRRLRRAPRRD